MNDEVSIWVIFPGDPSVGIFGATWEINHIPVPEDAEHREEIRQAFTEAFGVITGGGHFVVFSDERPNSEPDAEI